MNEVDLNILLIEKVKKFPELYKNSATLEKRKFIWQSIGEMLEVEAPFAISRWHCLLEQYSKSIQNNTLQEKQNFKYRKDMDFFFPYVKVANGKDANGQEEMNEKENSTENDYEFVISEADLDEISSDESDYNFVDVDEDNFLPKTKKRKESIDNLDLNGEDLKNDVNDSNPGSGAPSNDKSQEYLLEEEELIQMDDPNDFLLQSNEDEKPLEANNEMNMFSKTAMMLEGESDNEKSENLLEQRNSSVSCLTEKNPLMFSTETGISETTHHSVGGGAITHSQTNGKESSFQKDCRCEDEIFGELVAVMLKKLPPEKKRSVKREIMNILL